MQVPCLSFLALFVACMAPAGLAAEVPSPPADMVRIAAAQPRARLIDWHMKNPQEVLAKVEQTLGELERIVDRAAERHCDVIALPEDTLGLGHWQAGNETLSREVLPQAVGRMLARFGAAAAKHRMYVVCCNNNVEPGGAIYNTAFLLGRDGKEIGRYRKVCPTIHERFCTPGDKLPVFNTKDLGGVGMLICYDMVFPETARALALGGADVIFHPTLGGAAIGDGDISRAAFRTRAVENFVYIVVSQRGAGSMIISPQGRVLVEAQGADSLAVADIDPFGGREGGDAMNHQRDMRARLFRERNPAAFGILTDPNPPVLAKLPATITQEEAVRMAQRVLTVGEEEFRAAAALAAQGKTDEAIAAFTRLRREYRDSWIDRAAAERLAKLPRQPQRSLPVFPGAEGFGTDTPAGRGGKVIEVTSLADDGPGTLRAALTDPVPRTIVFRVGGIIELRSELQILQPFVTVAGQTAPGDGICIKNAGIMIGTHDVLLQHLRVRPGNEGRVNPANNDAVSILGRHSNIGGAHHVVVDHVSASWGEDETVSTWYGAHDITISWSIISEALNRGRHRKGTHSAGLLIGDGSQRVSVHHCLLAHNDFRNPLISKGGTHDFASNVIYDWGAIPAEIFDTDSNTFVNFIGNFFRPGPSTRPGPYEITINPGQRGIPKIYVEGNIGPHRPDAQTDEWALVCRGWGKEGVASQTYRAPRPFTVAEVKKSPAAEAFSGVLAKAGATRPKRDTVDRRVVSEVEEKSGKIIDSPTDVGGYPALARGTAQEDSDHDGMPDAWERQQGLNPDDPRDAARDRVGDGYTNLERYLHWLSH